MNKPASTEHHFREVQAQQNKAASPLKVHLSRRQKKQRGDWVSLEINPLTEILRVSSEWSMWQRGESCLLSGLIGERMLSLHRLPWAAYQGCDCGHA